VKLPFFGAGYLMVARPLWFSVTVAEPDPVTV
jgi:hypothetical protein